MAFGFPPTRGLKLCVICGGGCVTFLMCEMNTIVFLLNAGKLSTPFQGSTGTWSLTHAERVENYNLSVAH